MRRIKLVIEYDGTPYSGWQYQEGCTTVQGEIERCLALIIKDASRLSAAGRTDAGVHAFGQVAHFDTTSAITPFKVMSALNHHLRPHPIAITHAEYAPADFHARFSAMERQYIYRIVNRRAPLAIDHNRAWVVYSTLDIAAMREAAAFLEGTHDFTTFRASECQSPSPIKTINAFEVIENAPYIELHVRAKSFLHHQVRNLAGALVYVGKGKWDLETLKQALAAHDRKAGAVNAPPCGLYFVRVVYPPEID